MQYDHSDFNPRSPCGERQPLETRGKETDPFQSSLPVWGATVYRSVIVSVYVISILAPRVGSDKRFYAVMKNSPNFNPRSPCGERLKEVTSVTVPVQFQSSLPVWGATVLNAFTGSVANHFNPRSPCGERPRFVLLRFSTQNFNPRSPCGERRHGNICAFLDRHFNPRSPCGERQVMLPALLCFIVISILAPRVGSDQAESLQRLSSSNFNPRSPCGERPRIRWRHRK